MRTTLLAPQHSKQFLGIIARAALARLADFDGRLG